MVIIKTKDILLHQNTLAKIQEDLQRQAATGIVVVPVNCELLAEVPDGEEIKLAAPVQTAEWLGDRGDYKCSICHEEAPNDGYNPAPYCYNCGRKMKRRAQSGTE